MGPQNARLDDLKQHLWGYNAPETTKKGGTRSPEAAASVELGLGSIQQQLGEQSAIKSARAAQQRPEFIRPLASTFHANKSTSFYAERISVKQTASHFS